MGWSNGIWRTLVALAPGVVASVSACNPASEAAASQGPRLAACRPFVEGLTAVCGAISVAEAANAPQENRLNVQVTVIRSLTSPAAPDPLVIVTGTEKTLPEAQLRKLVHVVGTRDVVLVEPRGIGRSAPASCDPNPTRGGSLEGLTGDTVAACAKQLGRDAERYSSVQVADDLDAIRKSLGYDRWNLLGRDRGAAAVRSYAERYAAHTRSLVLDGPAQSLPSGSRSEGRDAELVLSAMVKGCARDAGCTRAFPGFAKSMPRLLAKLGAAGIEVISTDPGTGKERRIGITRSGFLSTVRDVLKVQDLAVLLPFALHKAEAGDWGVLEATTRLVPREQSSVAAPVASLLLAACADRGKAEPLPDDPNSFDGAFQRELELLCGAWPVRQASTGKPKVQAPTLLVSGEFDPVSPPHWGEAMVKQLPSAQHVVVQGEGHGAVSAGCVPTLVAKFLDSPGETLETSCTKSSTRRSFFVDATGPGGS